MVDKRVQRPERTVGLAESDYYHSVPSGHGFAILDSVESDSTRA